MKNGLEEHYVKKGDKKLRFGYTTGSCAAAAAQAAARMLFSRRAADMVRLTTPKGITLFLEPSDAEWNSDSASCAIRKDAGDDPDVTDGMLIRAHVRKCAGADCAGGEVADGAETGAVVNIRGGEGIGTVALPGLEQPVGAPAINRVPREMIAREVMAVCAEYGYAEGMEVTISAPGGEELAKKTFNPRLGIRGGISILGTSGIVEPMSEQALIKAIEVEMRQKSASRKYLLAVPGNFGLEYLKENIPFDPEDVVKCANYVGQTIDFAANLDLSGLLFVAHIGKFVKVAGGIMNTHSGEADARMEILAACALEAGIDAATARRILRAATTEEGLRLIRESEKRQIAQSAAEERKSHSLRETGRPSSDEDTAKKPVACGDGIRKKTMDILMRKISMHLSRRAQGNLKVGAVIFSNVYGELGRTERATEILMHL